MASAVLFQGENRQAHSTRIAALDGMRGIAILMVLLHHVRIAWPHLLGPLESVGWFGWTGVDIFFALSGFLITSILLDSKSTLSSLRVFYLKRAFRIWPLYLVLLTAVTLLSVFLRQDLPSIRYLLMVQNFSPEMHAGLKHTWSLCIEEQYYLVWPLLVLFAPRQALLWIPMTAIIGAPLLRFWALGHGVPVPLIYIATQYRLDGIACGSALAIVCRQGLVTRTQLARWGLFIFPVAFIAAAILLYLSYDTDGHGSAFTYTAVALTSTALLCMALNPVPNRLGRFLSIGPLRYLGTISYGLYLLQPLSFSIFTRLPMLPDAVAALLGAGVAIGMAAISWRFFERPMIRLRSRFGG